MSKQLAFFITDSFQPLDLFGPLDAFEEVNNILAHSYRCRIISFEKGPVNSAAGHAVLADSAVGDVESVDYLIICGGRGVRTLNMNGQQKSALRTLADKAQSVMSICTGAFLLAALYDEQALTLTTHWRHCRELQQRCKNVTVLSDPLYVNSQRFWSSAGVLSGVDLALAVIRQDVGNTVAAKVAKQLVVYLQRKGSQNQFSELLEVQSAASLRLAPLIEWLTDNLDKSLSVADMAAFVAVSERHLCRLFKQHLNQTPAHYLNLLRLSQAQSLLQQDNRNLQQIARTVGFANYDSFRRAFERHFGVPPSRSLN